MITIHLLFQIRRVLIIIKITKMTITTLVTQRQSFKTKGLSLIITVTLIPAWHDAMSNLLAFLLLLYVSIMTALLLLSLLKITLHRLIPHQQTLSHHKILLQTQSALHDGGTVIINNDEKKQLQAVFHTYRLKRAT
jgi:uncharacterized protein (DUF58 family)